MVGTAGMLVGVSGALKKPGANARIVALEPSTSPFLTTGKGGPHRVEGTAAGFWPPHLRGGSMTRCVPSMKTTAVRWRGGPQRKKASSPARRAGLNLVAALDVARELGPGKVVATVAVDTGLRYLSRDLYR